MKTKIRTIVPDDIKAIKLWLAERENARWLGTFFQNDSLREEQLAFFLMKKDKKTYMVQHTGIDVGLIGLIDIDTVNRSAQIWCLLGNRDYRRKGIITTAHCLLLKKAFSELNLHSVNVWVADGNVAMGIYKKLHFNIIGRQRQCHMMDDVLRDRILFDMLRDDVDETTLSHIT